MSVANYGILMKVLHGSNRLAVIKIKVMKYMVRLSKAFTHLTLRLLKVIVKISIKLLSISILCAKGFN